MLLWILAALIAAIVVAGAVLNIVQTYLTSRVGQDVTGDLQEAVYDHLLGDVAELSGPHPHWRDAVSRLP